LIAPPRRRARRFEPVSVSDTYRALDRNAKYGARPVRDWPAHEFRTARDEFRRPKSVKFPQIHGDSQNLCGPGHVVAGNTRMGDRALTAEGAVVQTVCFLSSDRPRGGSGSCNI